MSTAVSTPVWNVSSSAALEMPCIFIFFRKAGSLVLLALLNGTPKRPASSWVDAARKARSGPRSPRDLFDRISGFSGLELHPVHPVHPVILSKDRWRCLKRGQVRAVAQKRLATSGDKWRQVALTRYRGVCYNFNRMSSWMTGVAASLARGWGRKVRTPQGRASRGQRGNGAAIPAPMESATETYRLKPVRPKVRVKRWCKRPPGRMRVLPTR